MVVIAAIALSLTLVPRLLETDPAGAEVHGADGETRYREVWINHSEYQGIYGTDSTGTCFFDDNNGAFKWFAEPTPDCDDYPLGFNLDALEGASSAEVFLDLWRGRGRVPFRINQSVAYRTADADNWSRTPKLVDIALSDLVVGDNTLFLEAAPAYHLHDAAIRLYDLPGAYPTGAGVTGISPSPSDGVITVGADETITLTAEVAGADGVEFIAYYDGFDENNDGITEDWHSFTRMNWHPGGVNKDGLPEELGYGTIGHVGTVLADGRVINGRPGTAGGHDNGVWTIEFDTSLIRNDSPLRFKVRALNEAGDDGFWVVDALGTSASQEYRLAREGDIVVDYAVDPDFVDYGLFNGGLFDDAITRDVTLNLTDAVQVTMLGNYFEQPRILFNPESPTRLDCGPDDEGRTVAVDWLTDVMDVTGLVEDGLNVVCYERTSGFVQFIENPGPLFVVRRDASGIVEPPGLPIVDACGPYVVGEGEAAQLDGTVTDDGPVEVEWSVVGEGEVAFDDASDVDTTATAEPGEYEIQLTATDGGEAVTAVATLVVDAAPVVDAGDDATVTLPAGLDLAATVDDEGAFVLSWSTQSGPADAVFDDELSLDTAVSFPVAGEYVLALSVDDGINAPVIDIITVEVLAASQS